MGSCGPFRPCLHLIIFHSSKPKQSRTFETCLIGFLLLWELQLSRAHSTQSSGDGGTWVTCLKAHLHTPEGVQRSGQQENPNSLIRERRTPVWLLPGLSQENDQPHYPGLKPIKISCHERPSGAPFRLGKLWPTGLWHSLWDAGKSILEWCKAGLLGEGTTGWERKGSKWIGEE